MSDERWYLATRNRRELLKVEIFADQDEALVAYARAEELAPYGNLGIECCLFGADSLATLCRTHASWFAPETIDTHALLPFDLEQNGKQGAFS